MEKLGSSGMKLIITTLALLSLAVAEQPISPQKWQNPVTWQRIRAEQTPSQVQQILGEPTATESTNTTEVWYYGNEPKTDENGTTERPKDGCLMFRRTPTEHLLTRWVEPNWKILPTWEQLQTDYKEAQAEQRAAQIAERKRVAEEAAAARAKQIEERKQLSAERAVMNEQRRSSVYTDRQARTTPKIPAAKPDAHTQMTSKYFITIGISFFVIAFIIAGSYGFKQFKS